MHIRPRNMIPLALPLVITIVAWAIFTWPLPQHVISGIPSSHQNVEKGHVRAMLAGDHLQLMYHFWLASDMVAGKTPIFQNLYEFNTGNDDDRYEPGPYYIPFSLVYGVGRLLLGSSFGWNLVGFVSLLLTYAMTYLLARRYTTDQWIAALAAIVSISLPYRWAVYLGGSPTGFAMALIPAILLGVDIAVRDHRMAGGVLAGTAILMAWCSDLHVFFFGVLVTPVWCFVSFIQKQGFRWRERQSYLLVLRGLAPTMILGVAALALSQMTAQDIGGTGMSKGWTLGQVAPYSPRADGLFSWQRSGITNQVYFGYTMSVLLLAGGAAAITSFLRDRAEKWRMILTMVLLYVGLAGIVSLALGTNGPFGGLPLVVCRKLIPPYSMIRQTGKIFCLMPSLLALALAIGLSQWLQSTRRRTIPLAMTVGLMLLLVVEYRSRISPTICLIDNEQGAYEAILDDSEQKGLVPRAIAIPLWPGNSHWSSLQQYYASVYRIRMLNGYRPAVPEEYLEDTFRLYESMNQGVITDAQLDNLYDSNINYLLLHEDAFPAQVSPFPVGHTLSQLLDHPRLALLKQSENVWAFEILEHARAMKKQAGIGEILFPSRRWEIERYATDGQTVNEGVDLSDFRSVTLTPAVAPINLTTRANVCNAPDLRWLLRARGNGILKVSTEIAADTVVSSMMNLELQDDRWRWHEIPIQTQAPFIGLRMQIECADGKAELDTCLLAAGPWKMPAAGDTLELPATSFFHAGYTDLNRNCVVLRPERESHRTILFGPLLPIAEGSYMLNMAFDSSSETGREVATIRIVTNERTFSCPVVAGSPAQLAFTMQHNLPLNIQVDYSRDARMSISSFTLLRTD